MSHTLLLADPSPAIRRVVEMTFADTGVDVVSAVDGEQAIQCIAEKRPDIVLADIVLPKRNGYDVCEWVKSQDAHKAVPVLLLAGAFEPVDDARAREAGCNGVLVKPFEPQHVIARVQELLGGVIGGPTRATADVPRRAARLTPPRPVELPSRDDRERMPDDLVDIDDTDFGGARDFDGPAAALCTPPAGEPERGGDALDDYFDQLDEAVASAGDRHGSMMPAGPESLRGPWPVPAPDATGRARAFDVDEGEDEADDGGSDGELPTLGDLLAAGGDASGAALEDVDTADDAGEGDGIPTLEELLGGDTDIEEAAPPPPPPLVAEAVPVPPARDAAPSSPTPPATPGEPAPPASDDGSRTIADVFSALLAADLASMPLAAAPAPAASDDLVDEVARRVTERLAAEHGAAVEQAVARAVQEAVAPAIRAAVGAAVEAQLPPVLEGAAKEVARAADAEVTRVVRDVVADVSERLVRDEIARIRGRV